MERQPDQDIAISFVSEIQRDESEFHSLALEVKAQHISTRFAIDAEPIREVIQWAAEYLGEEDTLAYLREPSLSPAEAASFMSSGPDDDSQWEQTVESYAEQPPRLEVRFDQLLQLKESATRLRDAYPELAMQLVRVPYKDVYTTFMPAFNPGDVTTSRLDNPANVLAQIYEGEVAVGQDLLRAMRGNMRQGIPNEDFQCTPFSPLSIRSSLLGNYGLMLVAKQLYTRAALREIHQSTGVDCMSAGLAEGVAIASFGGLRPGDVIGFPQYIPNSEGDYYSGVNVGSYGNVPRLYFGLWRSEGEPNCLLAVTSKVL